MHRYWKGDLESGDPEVRDQRNFARQRALGADLAPVLCANTRNACVERREP